MLRANPDTSISIDKVNSDDASDVDRDDLELPDLVDAENSDDVRTPTLQFYCSMSLTAILGQRFTSECHANRVVNQYYQLHWGR